MKGWERKAAVDMSVTMASTWPRWSLHNSIGSGRRSNSIGVIPLLPLKLGREAGDGFGHFRVLIPIQRTGVRFVEYPHIFHEPLRV